MKRNKKISLLDIILITFILSIVISVEGGLIYTFIYTKFDYIENNGSKYLTLLLVLQRIPLIFSAILARIPTNLLDKFIAVSVSWGIVFGIERLRMHKKTV